MATTTSRPGPLGARDPELAEPDHEQLWDAVGSDAERAWLNLTRLLFPDREAASEAVAVLRGISGAPTISMAPAPGLRAPRIDAEARTAATAARRIGGIGALVGAVLGSLVALLGPMDLPVLAATLLLAFLGAGFGGLVGALVGLSLNDPFDDDPVIEVEAGPDAVVVTVHSLRTTRIRRVGESLGGIPIDPHAPLSSPPRA
jgi:uncharacterized membrane protein